MANFNVADAKRTPQVVIRDGKGDVLQVITPRDLQVGFEGSPGTLILKGALDINAFVLTITSPNQANVNVSNDKIAYFILNDSGVLVTVRLPTPPSGNGQTHIIKDYRGTATPAAPLRVVTTDGSTIDGQGTMDISVAYGAIMFVWTGQGWVSLALGASGAGAGAASNLQYVTWGTEVSLTNSRLLSVTSGHLTLNTTNPNANLGLAATGTPGTYTFPSSVTTDAQGRVTAVVQGTAGLAADREASYVVMGLTASLPNERALTAGTGIKLADGGANGNATLSVNDAIVATISGSTFGGAVKFNGGLSGSLQQLTTGISYLVAGPGISITTQSNGQIFITASITASSGGGSTLTADFLDADWVTGSNKIRTTSSVFIGSGTQFADSFGSDVRFYFSGTRNPTLVGTAGGAVAVFGGDVVYSASQFYHTSSLWTTVRKDPTGVSRYQFLSRSTIFTASLFEISDEISGSLFAVSNFTNGIPIIDIFSDHKIVLSGTLFFGSGTSTTVNPKYVFFSGTRGITGSAERVVTFDGDIRVSGTFNLGPSGSHRISVTGSDMWFYDPNNSAGWTLTQLAASGSGGSGTGTGDNGASYVVLGLTASLSNERVLAAGTGISIVDSGPNGTVTIGLASLTSQSSLAYDGYCTGSLTWTGTTWTDFRGIPGNFTDRIATGISRSASTFSVNQTGLYLWHSDFNYGVSAGYLAFRLSGSSGTLIQHTSYDDGGATGNARLDGIVSLVSGSTFKLQFVRKTGGDVTWVASDPIDGENMVTGRILAHLIADPLTIGSGSSSTGGTGNNEASYVVLGLTSSLTNERVLTAGDGISIVDNGANSTVVISLTPLSSQSATAYNGYCTGSTLFDSTTWSGFTGAVGNFTDTISTGISRSASTFFVSQTGYYHFHSFFNTLAGSTWLGFRLSSSNGTLLQRTSYGDVTSDPVPSILQGIVQLNSGSSFTLQYALKAATGATFSVSDPLDGESMRSGEISIFRIADPLTINSSSAGSGGTGNNEASYVVLSSTSSLTNERVLTAGFGVAITDNGSNNTVVISLLTGSNRLDPDSNDIIIWRLTELTGNRIANYGSSGSFADLTGSSQLVYGRAGVYDTSIDFRGYNTPTFASASNTVKPKDYDINVSAWIYPYQFLTGVAIVKNLTTGTYDTASPIILSIDGAYGYPFLQIRSTDTASNWLTVDSSRSLALLTWNHFGFSLSGSGSRAVARFYLNGDFVKSMIISGTIDYGNNGWWSVGGIPPNGAESGDYKLNEIRVANVVRNDQWWRDVYLKGLRGSSVTGSNSSTTVTTTTQSGSSYSGYTTASVWWNATGSWTPFFSGARGHFVDIVSRNVTRNSSSFTVGESGAYYFHAGFNTYGSDAYISLRLSGTSGVVLQRSSYRTNPEDQNPVTLDGVFEAGSGSVWKLEYIASGTVFAWTGSNPMVGGDNMWTGEVSLFKAATSGSGVAASVAVPIFSSPLLAGISTTNTAHSSSKQSIGSIYFSPALINAFVGSKQYYYRAIIDTSETAVSAAVDLYDVNGIAAATPGIITGSIMSSSNLTMTQVSVNLTSVLSSITNPGIFEARLWRTVSGSLTSSVTCRSARFEVEFT